MAATQTRPEDRTEEQGQSGATGTTPTSEVVTKIVVAIVAVGAVIALVAHFGYGWNPGDAIFGGPASVSQEVSAPEAHPVATTPVGPSTPTRVSIPAIGASSSLIGLGQKPDGSLAVPPLSNPMQASWYDKSPTPGSIGPAVILGHINGGGKPGIFAELGRVQPGQEVSVDRADGQTAVFTVSHVDLVPKDAFPSDQVYGDTPDPQLRLITCGGELDRAAHNYLSNVVVYATMTSIHRT